jgi:hypothetical protein
MSWNNSPAHMACKVRPTGDARGNGAFATGTITSGTFICEYEGEMIDEEEFFKRYPDGVVSHLLSHNSVDRRKG